MSAVLARRGLLKAIGFGGAAIAAAPAEVMGNVPAPPMGYGMIGEAAQAVGGRDGPSEATYRLFRKAMKMAERKSISPDAYYHRLEAIGCISPAFKRSQLKSFHEEREGFGKKLRKQFGLQWPEDDE